MKTSASRLVVAGVVIALIVLGVIAMGGRSRDATAASRAAVAQLEPVMRGVVQMRASCVADRDAVRGTRYGGADAAGMTLGAGSCSAEELAATRTGRSIDMRVAQGCVASGDACVHVDEGRLHVELVTGAVPVLGALRIEADGSAAAGPLRWSCRPLRATPDSTLVREACGDVPVG